MGKNYCTYIMSNGPEGTLYIGMTGDLMQRVQTHKQGMVPGFTARYKLDKLVYYETFSTPMAAIAHEKKLKRWYRQWKINLIEKTNPSWSDLAWDW